ncbi:hypothetical protein FH972_023744 [Carpinus fangiana]|uniref:Uncharacterized protein n=1 Tax=Carpinus fangiana TaxID=176857 RepID=A0A5N6KWK4_9ROSI|nr:hypothetical protein FH972_023744 [Carpinus fangiana]
MYPRRPATPFPGPPARNRTASRVGRHSGTFTAAERLEVDLDPLDQYDADPVPRYIEHEPEQQQDPTLPHGHLIFGSRRQFASPHSRYARPYHPISTQRKSVAWTTAPEYPESAELCPTRNPSSRSSWNNLDRAWHDMTPAREPTNDGNQDTFMSQPRRTNRTLGNLDALALPPSYSSVIREPPYQLLHAQRQYSYHHIHNFRGLIYRCSCLEQICPLHVHYGGLETQLSALEHYCTQVSRLVSLVIHRRRVPFFYNFYCPHFLENWMIGFLRCWGNIERSLRNDPSQGSYHHRADLWHSVKQVEHRVFLWFAHYISLCVPPALPGGTEQTLTWIRETVQALRQTLQRATLHFARGIPSESEREDEVQRTERLRRNVSVLREVSEALN